MRIRQDTEDSDTYSDSFRVGGSVVCLYEPLYLFVYTTCGEKRLLGRVSKRLEQRNSAENAGQAR